MKQSYRKPAARILEAEISNIICGSLPRKEYSPTCNKKCRLWHICRDRYEGQHCKDWEL